MTDQDKNIHCPMCHKRTARPVIVPDKPFELLAAKRYHCLGDDGGCCRTFDVKFTSMRADD